MNVFLYDAADNLLGSFGYSTLTDGNTLSFDEQISSAGTYYLKVSGQAVGNYDLAVYSTWSSAGAHDGLRTYKHSFGSAHYLASGSYTRTHLEQNNAPLTDYYRFSANAGDTFTAAITGAFNAGWARVTLYDENFVSLGQIQTVYDGETKELSEAITKTGLYYLSVSGTSVGSYQLAITGAQTDGDSDNDGLNDAVEYFHHSNPYVKDTDGDGIEDGAELLNGGNPNAFAEYAHESVSNTKSAATQLPYFNQMLTAEYQGTSNTVHWFKFDKLAGEGITVATTAHLNNSSPIRVFLYSDANQLLADSSNFYDGNTVSFDEEIASAGTYYIKVTGAGVGSYDLSVNSTWSSAGAHDGLRTYKHSFGSAHYLASGSYTRTHLTKSNTPLTDYYRFSANAGDTFTAAITGAFNAGWARVTLYDENFVSLGQIQTVYDGETKLLNVTFNTDGDYYLGISGSAVGAYTLVATFNGIPTQTADSIDNTHVDRLLSLIADPIDISTGAHVLSRNVMHVQGALPLDMELNYSSFNPKNGNMGYGWNHSFNMKLEFQAGQTVALTWPTGRITHYSNPSSGRYQIVDGDAKDKFTTINGGYQLIDKNQVTYEFNANGQLISKTNKVGLALNYSYTSNQLTSVTEPLSGRYIDFTYDLSGRVSSITALDAGTVSFTYNGSNNLITITDALTHTESFTYDENHRLLTGTDALNVVYFSNTYDAQGRVIQQEDARTGNDAGNISYTNNADGSTTAVYTDRTGKSKTYIHDAQYRLISLTDELGNTSTYSYDSQGNKISETDNLGRTTRYYYDLENNLIQSVDTFGSTSTFAYDENSNLISLTNANSKSAQFTYTNNRLSSTTDALSQITQTQYNADGLVVATIKPNQSQTDYVISNGQTQSITDGTGNSVSLTYDNAGRVLTMTDAAGKVTTYTYDLKGQLLTQTDPLNHVTTFTYDAKGRKTSITNARGFTTSYSYDGNDKLITETNALNGVTKYTYDGEDRLLTIENALGHITTIFTYDSKGQMIGVTNALFDTTQYGYDAVGNKISETNAAGDTVAFGYDGLDRLITQIDTLNRNQLFSYDKLNNLLSQTDAKGNKTQFSYDASNRLLTTTDALNGTTTQSYSLNGQRASLTDANNNTLQYTYDAEGRLVRLTTMDNKYWQTVFNSRGAIKKLTNARGQVSQFTYDDALRLTSTIETTGNVSYEYDANGNRTKATTSQGQWLYTYDALDRLITHTDVYGNLIQYQYDAVNQLTRITYPDGKAVHYTYSQAGQLTKVTDWENRVTSYYYDTLGRLITTTHSNGLTTNYSYDKASQLTGKTTKNSGNDNIIDYSYTYDLAGMLTQETGFNSLKPAPVITNITYGLDNRALTANNLPVQYDFDGNMTSGWLNYGLSSFTYDSRNRLTSAGGINYQYNPDNHRIASIEGANTTRYIVNPATTLEQVLMETDQNGTVKAWNVYGIGLIGRQSATEGYHTYHYDYRGSTVALTRENASISNRYFYSPFGQKVQQWGSSTQPFAYNGRDGVMTDNNGLYYMRARFYNPSMRRFINRDVLLGNPISGQSLNRYAYVQGNPVMLVDPEGELGHIAAGAVIGGLFGGAMYAIQNHDKSGGEFWLGLLKSTSIGAASGATAAAVGPFVLGGVKGIAILKGAAIGGVSSMAGSAVDIALSIGLNPKKLEAEHLNKFGEDILVGMLAGGVFSKLLPAKSSMINSKKLAKGLGLKDLFKGNKELRKAFLGKNMRLGIFSESTTLILKNVLGIKGAMAHESK
ncbi:RHS repeat-associated core domain-containing protein [Thalassotalea piscium]